MKPGNLRSARCQIRRYVPKDEGAQKPTLAVWRGAFLRPRNERLCWPQATDRKEWIMERRLFTSESVTEGHPDKICDQISDAILDAIIAQGPARPGWPVRPPAPPAWCIVMGEITTCCYVDIPAIARQAVREIGYDRAKYGFDCEHLLRW